ncbi:MAG: tetratricopeptide repeat protein [Candidatus Xenobia bacterium]
MRSEFIQRRLERAIQENPHNPYFHYELGKYWQEESEYAHAVRFLEKAVSLDPYYSLAHFELGIVYTFMAQFETAIKEWQQMVDEDNDLKLEGIDYSRQARLGLVIEAWERYKHSQPQSPIIAFHTGFVFLILGRPDRAMQEYQEALKLNNRYDLVHYFMGHCHMRRREWELAALEMNSELALRPQLANAHFWHGLASLELNKAAQAMKSLQEAVRLRPGYVKAHLKLGQCYARAGNDEAASRHLQAAIDLSPRMEDAYFEQGQILERQYRMDDAVLYYARTIELNPRHRPAHIHLGLLYKKLGRTEEALKSLDVAANLDPMDADVHYYLGLLHEQMNEPAEAVTSFTNALTASPTHQYAMYGLGMAYKKLGPSNYADAAREFGRAVEINPKDVQALNALGETQFLMGNFDDALDQFMHVLDTNPRDLRARYFRGAALFRKGKTDEAIEEYRRIVGSEANSPYAQFTLGAAHVHQGNFDEARKCFETATSMDPTSEADLKLLATLHLMGAVGIWHAETSKELVEKSRRLEMIWERTIRAMVGAVDARDEYTRQHSEKVATTAKFFAEYLKLPPEIIDAIWYGGLLHDIGKVGVSDFILRKPGKLTDWEFEMMQQHPRIGWDLVKDLELPWNTVMLKSDSVLGKQGTLRHNVLMAMILYHHERYDGTGYPTGKKGSELPYEGQIMTIADFWDALRSQRSYKKAFTTAQTMEEMQKLKGKHFMPDLVEKFEGFLDWAAALKGEQWARMYGTP